MKWRIPLPEDRTQRTLVLAIVTSLLFHLFVLVPFVVIPGFLQSAPYVKRGEPLLVDIAPERPEEKAPLGNPSRPPAPPESEAREAPPAPRTPPAPRMAPSPPRVAPAPRPAPVQPPAPPRAVAKSEPAPQPMVKTPEPTPPAPETAPAETAQGAPGPAAPTQPQVAAARPPSIWRQPGGGGGLQGGGRGGVEGDPIPLDTPEPKYQDYFNKVRERIKSKWVYPREAGERGIEGELVIEFHIAKDGRLEFIALRHSSGVSILDAYALNAVKFAEPFPPVPDELAKRTLAINGQFRYQIVSGFVNQFLR